MLNCLSKYYIVQCEVLQGYFTNHVQRVSQVKVRYFLIPNSISVASFAPQMGDLNMALIALLFEILYFSQIYESVPSGVFIRPYYVYAYIAPTMRFLLIFGVMPPPLSMKGTSCAFVFSALDSCFSRCESCFRFCWMIFPKYLYSCTCSISVS